MSAVWGTAEVRRDTAEQPLLATSGHSGDLRNSFASVPAASVDSLLIIGKFLGHKNAASTQRYAHLGDDPLRSAANRISQQIAAAMDGQREAEVVEFGKSPA